MEPTSRVIAASLGKMPITSVRRLISPIGLSMGLVGVQLGTVLGREAHVGEHVGLGLVHQGGQLGDLGPELVGDAAPLLLCRLNVVLGEGGGDEGRDNPSATPTSMGVAHEVDAATLPGGGEDLGYGCLDALMGVKDDELDAAQAAPRQLAQEGGPEGLGLGRADIHAQHLGPAVGVDADRDDDGDRHNAAGLADLQVGGVDHRYGQSPSIGRSLRGIARCQDLPDHAGRSRSRRGSCSR
jgi:hypothetical protein